jgi:hypothetical protein
MSDTNYQILVKIKAISDIAPELIKAQKQLNDFADKQEKASKKRVKNNKEVAKSEKEIAAAIIAKERKDTEVFKQRNKRAVDEQKTQSSIHREKQKRRKEDDNAETAFHKNKQKRRKSDDDLDRTYYQNKNKRRVSDSNAETTFHKNSQKRSRESSKTRIQHDNEATKVFANNAKKVTTVNDAVTKSFVNRNRVIQSAVKTQKGFFDASRSNQLFVNAQKTGGFIDARTRLTEARTEGVALTNQQRRDRAERRQSSYGESLTSRAAVATGAAAGITSVMSLRNYSELETMGQRMRFHFGKEQGMKMFDELKTFAAQTAFTLKESTILLEGVKMGKAKLGLSQPEQMMGFMKKIAAPILAFGYNQQDRMEIAHQLKQVFMKPKADERQDIRVMENRGLPMRDIIQQYYFDKTGKMLDLDEIAKINNGITGRLIAASLEWISERPETAAMMVEKSRSFTQAWDSFKENLAFTSGGIGASMDKAFNISGKLRTGSDFLSGMQSGFAREVVGPNGEITKESPLWSDPLIRSVGGAIAGLGIAAALPSIKRAGKYLMSGYKEGGGVKGMASSNLGTGLAIAGVIGTATNFGNVIDDINNRGMRGLISNADQFAMIALGLANPLTRLATIAAMLYNLADKGGYFATGDSEAYNYKNTLSDKILNLHYKIKGFADDKDYSSYMMTEKDFQNWKNNDQSVKNSESKRAAQIFLNNNTYINGEIAHREKKPLFAELD